MTLSDLPDPDDHDAIAQFAVSINGYEHFGSFQAAADQARAKRRQSITDLQNELFMSYRGSVHRRDRAYVALYKELEPMFRRFLE